MPFGAFRVGWDTFMFFKNFHERKARGSEATENARVKQEAWWSKTTENTSAKGKDRGKDRWGVLLFFHDSLLTFLLKISALWCPIKIKFGMSLRYVLGRVVFELYKSNGLCRCCDVLSYHHTIIHTLNSIEPTNFILGTNIQQHEVHLMIKVKVTLTDSEGHRWRSKVIKNNKWTHLPNNFTHRHHTQIPRFNMFSDI